LAADVLRTHPFLGTAHAHRLVSAYGTRVRALLEPVRSAPDLGQCFGADLYEVEVNYLMAQEWARTAEDVLWRRSKLGLRVSAAEAAGLEAWMNAAHRRPAA
jgi:glycerol-3-phosphate dehydrogenase